MNGFPDIYQAHFDAATQPDPAKLAEIWEPDGVLEFPYARAGGVRRLVGVEHIASYFDELDLFGDFTVHEAQSWDLGHDGWVIEMRASSTLRATGQGYEQNYVVRFGLSDRGRIAWMREYWNPDRL